MNWIRIAIILFLPTQALAQSRSDLPPDWMVRGLEAAIGDPNAVRGVVQLRPFSDLFLSVPPGDRASGVIDKLLPLLGDPDSDVRAAAAGALANIPKGDRTGNIVDKLLPLLRDPNNLVRVAAADALAS